MRLLIHRWHGFLANAKAGREAVERGGNGIGSFCNRHRKQILR